MGKEHPSTLETINNIAVVYFSRGRYGEAPKWFTQALSGFEKALGK